MKGAASFDRQAQENSTGTRHPYHFREHPEGLFDARASIVNYDIMKLLNMF